MDDNSTGCPSTPNPLPCTNLTNTPTDLWNYEYNSGLELCTSASAGCSLCQIGKVTQPPPPLGKPTVTVWYNNEVCLYLAYIVVVYYLVYLLTIPNYTAYCVPTVYS